LLATVPAASCRFACRADEIRAARNVITADRGGKSAAQEGDAAVAIEFGGPCSSWPTSRRIRRTQASW